jgi:signal transduction histidine kinase
LVRKLCLCAFSCASGILGFTELLQEPQLTGKNNENIKRKWQTMLNIINDIINISKVESDKLRFLKLKLICDVLQYTSILYK